ncbi:MAG: hypothetical protein HKN33_03790 [Pyrinomonadaceae bacterium]|nr:hypothetical protein [Pyrinomonadaceae bacterium]
MYFRKEWNNTGVPRARLFTFRTYGSWLHEDHRGSIDRNNNVFGDPYYPPHPEWERFRFKELKSEPVKLTKRMRKAVIDSIEDTCKKRGWHLIAKNVRTNHVHSVINIGGTKPGLALNALKANATRVLRERGLWPHEHSPWVSKGSKRPLWTEQDVDEAVDYVINGQGPNLD